MKRISSLMLFAVLLFCGNAFAQSHASIAPPACDPEGYDHTLFRATLNPPCKTNPDAAPIRIKADVEFDWGNTIDFAAHSRNTEAVGPMIGYVWIRVEGAWYLMPYFAPNKDGTSSR